MILPNNDCIQSITIVHKQALLDQLSRYMIMLKCKLAVTKCKEQAARKIEAAQQNQKRGFDKKRKAPRKYRPGDLVLIKKQHPATGASRKLQNPYSGPLVVKVALPNDRYIVTDMTGSYRAENRTNYERTVAVDRMKPWCTPGVVNMAPIKKKIDRQEQVKQNMRKMRAKIKSDPVKYEEYKRKERERYKKRKAEGKIQKISDLPERQQRAKHSPPPSPSSIEPDTLNLTPNRQLLQGQKRSRNHRRKLNKTIKSLQERNKLLEKKVTFPDQLCKELCCDDVLGEDCLSRKCKHCKDKQVLFNISQPEERIRYNLWQSKKMKVNIKGEEKDCQKTVKEVVESTVREFVIKFVNDLPKYMTHLLNRIHQYNTIDKLKKN
ncbi:unnamed protein product [Callosobruchus maculatus]|uniref:Uncharacterized protein n=1 Tax=Callosobruchus maculatus TaxID=64391 RepID=A0A653BMM4_CALMS|nr:unnamed protein product [Callosobruchus maculatus]